MVSLKGRQSVVDPLALIFRCQIDKKLLETGMLDPREDVLPAIRPENPIFDALDFIISE